MKLVLWVTGLASLKLWLVAVGVLPLDEMQVGVTIGIVVGVVGSYFSQEVPQ